MAQLIPDSAKWALSPAAVGGWLMLVAGVTMLLVGFETDRMVFITLGAVFTALSGAQIVKARKGGEDEPS